MKDLPTVQYMVCLVTPIVYPINLMRTGGVTYGLFSRENLEFDLLYKFIN